MDIRVRTFNELGLNAFSNKNYKLALEYFSEALNIDSGNETVLINKSKVYVERRALVEAISTLDNLLNINSSNEEAIDMRKNCLELLRKGATDVLVPVDGDARPPSSVKSTDTEEIFPSEKKTRPQEKAKDLSLMIPQKKSSDKKNDVERNEAIELSNEIIRKVTGFEKKGIVINDIKPYLEKISSSMDSGKPGKALGEATKCMERLEATEKRYDRTQRLAKRIQQNILDLRAQGANVKDINEELKALPELLRKGEYEEVLERTAGILDRIATRKILYQDALDAIRECWQAIKGAMKEGIRDSEADEQLSKGRKSITKGDYEEAIDHARQSQNIIQTSTDVIKKLNNELNSMKENLLRYEALKMNVSIFKDTILEIEKNIQDRAIDLADDRVFQLKDKLTALEEEYNRGMVYYQMTKYKVDEAGVHGVDTSGMEQSLKSMLAEVRRGKYENARVIAEEIQSFVNESRSVQDRNKALLAIEESEELYEDCRHLGIDVTGTNQLIKKAKLYFNDTEFKPSVKIGNKAAKKLLKCKLLYLLEDTRDILPGISRDSELDTDMILEELFEAEDLITSKDLREAEKLLLSIRHPLFEERAKDQLIKTQEKINEVIALGGDGAEARELFGRSQEEFKDKNYEKAFEISEQAWETAENAKMYEELIDELKSVREYIDRLEDEGIDVSEAKEALSEAKPALDNHFYQTALDYSSNSKKLAKRAEKMHGFVARIGECEERLGSMEKKDGNLDPLYEDLDRARKMVRKGKKDKLESILFHLEEEIDELVGTHEAARVKDAKKLKKEGNSLFKKGDVKEAIRVFNRALKINPNDETIIHNKGVAYKKLKMYKKSLKCCKKTLAINPDYSAAMTLKRLCEEELKKN